MPHNRTRSRLARLAGASAALALAGALLSGCSLLPRQQKELQPPLVKPAQEKFDTVEAKKGTIERYFIGTATFASSRVVPLYYTDAGRLKDIYVNQGDTVKKGQLVAELDTGDLDTRINLEKLNLERAQIELDKAVKSGAGKNDLRVRQIDVERERITIDSLQAQFEAAKLTSPMDGVVSYRDTLQAGDDVTGYKPIVSIADPSSLQLVHEADDPQTLLPLQPGMKVVVTVDGAAAKGVVTQSPSSAPITDDKDVAERNGKLLYISLTGPAVKAQMGDSADIKILLEKHDNVIVLPRSGLRSYLGRTYVQVLDGERRKEVDVESGITTATDVEIVKGLDPGQQVILNN
ncbi:efflux RND transporter periplasmic adaptor subunit [Paenibacillus humicola]|uniref:efflux RND transporter periplasmic adaptor subunit n=1 Tax=Paenibacillus humicola TaxID=3110540 RepID=UPI00237C0E6C|nr:efflux RND transporter periplasmic adaptor subunit [Paenibacillus humicola]